MKKIVVLFALFLILGANIYWDCIDSTGNLSELQLANIEALASGESGASNTGPREEKKCYSYYSTSMTNNDRHIHARKCSTWNLYLFLLLTSTRDQYFLFVESIENIFIFVFFAF